MLFFFILQSLKLNFTASRMRIDWVIRVVKYTEARFIQMSLNFRKRRRIKLRFYSPFRVKYAWCIHSPVRHCSSTIFPRQTTLYLRVQTSIRSVLRASFGFTIFSSILWEFLCFVASTKILLNGYIWLISVKRIRQFHSIFFPVV
jgi:hypothetical protein